MPIRVSRQLKLVKMGELLRKQDHQDWVRDFLGGGEREEGVEGDTQTSDLGNGGVIP